MRNNNSFSIYKFAIILSIVLHLFFVTTVEAAALLNRTFVPSFHEPLITIKTIHREPNLDTVHSPAIGRKQKPSGERKRKVKSRMVRAAQALPKKEVKVNHQSFVNGASLKGAFQSFQDFQTAMDKRIEKFKKNLLDMTTRNQKSDPSDSLMSDVSDLEKVPVTVRKDLLPTYLKKMRFQIATKWLQQIQNFNFESQVAAIQYRILPDGTIFGLEFQSLDRNDMFLKACLKAVEEASPFGPLPFQFRDSEQEKYLTVVLTFYLQKQNQETSFSLERFRP